MVLRFSYVRSFFVLPQYTAYLSDQCKRAKKAVFLLLLNLISLPI